MKEIMGGKGRRGAGQQTQKWEDRQGREPQDKSTNREPRREARRKKILNLKPTPTFPHRVGVRVSQGEAAASSHPGPTTPTEGQGLRMGKVHGLGVQSRTGIHRAGGPKPLAQPPALPPQDPGQWAGEGGVILHPSSQDTCLHGEGRGTRGSVSLKRERRERGSQVWPLPEASAMASTALGKVPDWSPGMWVIGCPHPGRRG